MPRYILINNHCGYIFGEADAASPEEACAIVDADIGSYNREYEEASIDGSPPRGWQ